MKIFVVHDELGYISHLTVPAQQVSEELGLRQALGVSSEEEQWVQLVSEVEVSDMDAPASLEEAQDEEYLQRLSDIVENFKLEGSLEHPQLVRKAEDED
jgi:hypothetical protein